MQYIQACLLTKQNIFLCFDAGFEHMTARSRGNGTNYDWLRKSCGISTCDLCPYGNPEKYGRPMKSAIGFILLLQLAGFDRQEKINTGNPTTAERRGLGWGRDGDGGKTTKKLCKYKY